MQRQSCEKPYGVTPVGLFSSAGRLVTSPRPPVEGMAMRIAGWSFGSTQARLLALPAIAIAGCNIWMMLPAPSDAEGSAEAEPSPAIYAQKVSLVEDAVSSGTAPAHQFMPPSPPR